MGANNTSMRMIINNRDLNENITNIMTVTENDVQNVLTMSNTINITVGPNGELNCDSLNFTQTNTGEMKVATQINNQTATAIKNLLNNDVKTSAGMTNQLIQGFLAGIGQANNTDLEMDLTTSITNIIENNVTTSNINRILNEVKAINDTTLVINGKITSKTMCDIIQNNIVSLQSSTILTNIVSAVVDNATFNKIVTDATMANSITQKGLDDLISALLNPMAIIIIGIAIAIAMGG